MKEKIKTGRRGFLGSVAASATLAGIAPILSPLNAFEEEPVTIATTKDDPDEWMKQIKGKHRIVFDVTQPNEIFPFAWPRVFMLTNEKTGTPENQQGVVMVIRHKAIPYAFDDRVWEKYKFGEVFNIMDPQTKAPSLRNPFWKPKTGDFKVPGIGNVAIGVNELQASGAMVCVCETAIHGRSWLVSQQLKEEHEAVKKDWLAGLLPNIQLVPSGVWAIGRAQERGCGYCFTG
jgi:hypothetical protein